jgi:hypothetical protein
MAIETPNKPKNSLKNKPTPNKIPITNPKTKTHNPKLKTKKIHLLSLKNTRIRI